MHFLFSPGPLTGDSDRAVVAASGLCRLLQADAQDQEASSGFLISRLLGPDCPHPDLRSPGQQAGRTPILAGSGLTQQAVTK